MKCQFLPPANEVWGKVICLQVCVCPQGGYLTSYTPWDQVHPQDQVHPPGADTPQSRPPRSRPPRSRHPPEQGADTPPRADTPGADTPPEQTPPRTDTPWEQTPPRTDTPQSREQTPPGADNPWHRGMLGDTVNARAVSILLESNLVKSSNHKWVLVVSSTHPVT